MNVTSAAATLETSAAAAASSALPGMRQSIRTHSNSTFLEGISIPLSAHPYATRLFITPQRRPDVRLHSASTSCRPICVMAPRQKRTRDIFGSMTPSIFVALRWSGATAPSEHVGPKPNAPVTHRLGPEFRVRNRRGLCAVASRQRLRRQHAALAVATEPCAGTCHHFGFGLPSHQKTRLHVNRATDVN